MYTEDELLPISALQHLAFCERQWALIHLEAAWEENRLTAEGRQIHDKVHEAETETRGDIRIGRGLRLRSLRLGLIGMADVVEFHRLPEETIPEDALPPGVSLAGADGLWKPLIVEYKRGKPKIDRCDEVQVCAQALCLEEMLYVSIPSASIFYGKPRRRYEVVLSESLRRETEALAAHLHDLSRTGKTPPPQYSGKCDSCSLLDLCLPKAVVTPGRASTYLARALTELQDGKS